MKIRATTSKVKENRLKTLFYCGLVIIDYRLFIAIISLYKDNIREKAL
jgi:hypothetical protein